MEMTEGRRDRKDSDKKNDRGSRRGLGKRDKQVTGTDREREDRVGMVKVAGEQIKKIH